MWNFDNYSFSLRVLRVGTDWGDDWGWGRLEGYGDDADCYCFGIVRLYSR